MRAFRFCRQFVGGNMGETIYTRVSETPLSLDEAYQFVASPQNGAVNLFVGAVRNNHQGKNVVSLAYDVHPSLAEATFKEICQEAQKEWPGIRCYISHFKGHQEIGGMSVIVAVGSAHRAESYEASRYMIEELKKRAPVWKNEVYQDETSSWLNGVSLCQRI